MSHRAAGLLAHVTSLPGAAGADPFDAARRFLDWAAEAGQTLWQILPVHPTGADRCPYAGLSAHAGSLGLLSPPGARGAAALERAYGRVRRNDDVALRRAFESFVEDPLQRPWLEDWALFAALRERYEGRPWHRWPTELCQRRPAALRQAGRELARRIDLERYAQFVFFRSWEGLRREARIRGVRLVGDLPFYVGHDSADVWSHPELFDLDEAGAVRTVAGVPPDYFSETGQRWGHPIYRWRRIAEDGYAWWLERCRSELRLVDTLRLDHFRGFAGYWVIPAEARRAEQGRWVPGPGRELFAALSQAFPALPFFAEDLGEITEDVRALRREVGLSGTRVLQFGLGAEPSEHDPERIPRDCVVYTGTHDNDTARGWFSGLDADRHREVLRRLAADERTVVRRMIETAYESPAEWAVIPLQDVFELGSEARMNRPGTTAGNWRWRADPSSFTLDRAARLRGLAERSGRAGAGD